MTIEDFWNQAFLSALARLPVEEAKRIADEAVEAGIAHWQQHIHDWSDPGVTLWKDQEISEVPYSSIE
ncbi:hypothetical protein [Xanthomonas translucens]|jgi:hypothetical protein|uniref:hypothetical protein n=1 Tax=Xanthomonas campestris pv. translucens TaxID=343 RepID=UPI0012D991FF|nr:hypothetical protein [Xanthomonas translucens]